MPRDSAATTAFCAAISASSTASSRSPGPGLRGAQPALRNASYHLRQSAQKSSTSLPFAMKGWWSQESARRASKSGSVIRRMV